MSDEFMILITFVLGYFTPVVTQYFVDIYEAFYHNRAITDKKDRIIKQTINNIVIVVLGGLVTILFAVVRDVDFFDLILSTLVMWGSNQAGYNYKFKSRTSEE